MTDVRIIEARLIDLAKQHGVDLGIHPPARWVESADGQSLIRKRDPRLTYYGERLLNFAAAVELAERERCARIADKWERLPRGYASNVIAEEIRKGNAP